MCLYKVLSSMHPEKLDQFFIGSEDSKHSVVLITVTKTNLHTQHNANMLMQHNENVHTYINMSGNDANYKLKYDTHMIQCLASYGA